MHAGQSPQGVEAIVVSNHGGRQLDSLPSAIETLPEIVDAVGDRAEVILDGGVRRGTDVVKALALGAQSLHDRPADAVRPGSGRARPASSARSRSCRTRSTGRWRCVGRPTLADLDRSAVRFTVGYGTRLIPVPLVADFLTESARGGIVVLAGRPGGERASPVRSRRSGAGHGAGQEQLVAGAVLAILAIGLLLWLARADAAWAWTTYLDTSEAYRSGTPRRGPRATICPRHWLGKTPVTGSVPAPTPHCRPSSDISTGTLAGRYGLDARRAVDDLRWQEAQAAGTIPESLSATFRSSRPACMHRQPECRSRT